MDIHTRSKSFASTDNSLKILEDITKHSEQGKLARFRKPQPLHHLVMYCIADVFAILITYINAKILCWKKCAININIYYVMLDVKRLQ